MTTFLFCFTHFPSCSNAETELARVKVRSEEERHSMERKVHLMVEEAERRQHEAESLRHEVQAARDAEKDAKVKLMDFLNNSVADVSKTSPTWNGTTTLSPNGEIDMNIIVIS